MRPTDPHCSTVAPLVHRNRARHVCSSKYRVLSTIIIAFSLVLGCSRGGCGSRSNAPLGQPTTIPVQGDQSAVWVRAPDSVGKLVVYLHGRCEKLDETMKEWVSEGSGVAHILILHGDELCPDQKTRRWTRDLGQIDRRITAAIKAISPQLGSNVDTTHIILTGYSEGAARTCDLAELHPERYTKAVVIGAPDPPAVKQFAKTKAVATVAGEKDRQDLMLKGTMALQSAKIPAKMFILPKADHGWFGPEGGRLMKEILTWVQQNGN